MFRRGIRRLGTISHTIDLSDEFYLQKYSEVLKQYYRMEYADHISGHATKEGTEAYATMRNHRDGENDSLNRSQPTKFQDQLPQRPQDHHIGYWLLLRQTRFWRWCEGWFGRMMILVIWFRGGERGFWWGEPYRYSHQLSLHEVWAYHRGSLTLPDRIEDYHSWSSILSLQDWIHSSWRWSRLTGRGTHQ